MSLSPEQGPICPGKFAVNVGNWECEPIEWSEVCSILQKTPIQFTKRSFIQIQSASHWLLIANLHKQTICH